MGTFSIWHWLIVLIALIVLASPAIVIALASPVKTLRRMPYVWRILGAVVLIFALALILNGLIGEEPDPATAALGLIALPVELAVYVLVVLWSVHRIQATGLSRWWNLILCLPFVNLLWIVVLMVIPGRAATRGGAEDAVMG